mmetsp:Transcript_30442/g.97131  ORF Transcript_30442/g.97131 Transcript_30442/m.97131 type:complete len:266 (+) Transcript_30442:574-1371(+)
MARTWLSSARCCLMTVLRSASASFALTRRFAAARFSAAGFDACSALTSLAPFTRSNAVASPPSASWCCSAVGALLVVSALASALAPASALALGSGLVLALACCAVTLDTTDATSDALAPAAAFPVAPSPSPSSSSAPSRSWSPRRARRLFNCRSSFLTCLRCPWMAPQYFCVVSRSSAASILSRRTFSAATLSSSFTLLRPRSSEAAFSMSCFACRRVTTRSPRCSTSSSWSAWALSASAISKTRTRSLPSMTSRRRCRSPAARW